MNIAEKVTVSRRSELFLTRQLQIFMYKGSSIFLSAVSVFMVLLDCAFNSTLHFVPMFREFSSLLLQTYFLSNFCLIYICQRNFFLILLRFSNFDISIPLQLQQATRTCGQTIGIQNWIPNCTFIVISFVVIWLINFSISVDIRIYIKLKEEQKK